MAKSLIIIIIIILGIGMIKRNIAQQLTPTMEISVEGETITVSITAGPKTNKSSYKLGEEYAVSGEQDGKVSVINCTNNRNTLAIMHNRISSDFYEHYRVIPPIMTSI